MAEKNGKKPKATQEHWRRNVQSAEERRLKGRQQDKGVWFGLGMMGLVGWSVAIPTVLGVALGVHLDSQFEDQRSWTLMLLFIGIVIGCLNAWFWVKRESGDD